MPTAKQQPLPRTPRTDWPWPHSLDALTAAPDQHSLLFENDHVRVMRSYLARADCSRAHPSLASCFIPIELE
jgi:hypothetical protein